MEALKFTTFHQTAGKPMLDSKIEQLRHHFGIFNVEDWTVVTPEMILKQDGIGPKTLDYIRLHLCSRGLTLRDDRTPEYWLSRLKDNVEIIQSISDPELGNDNRKVTPFTILVDSAEQDAFCFLGMKDKDNNPMLVQTEIRSLGRYPDSLGDYSIDGYFGQVAVERKSVKDCQSTVLGWDGARERFEQELANLSSIKTAMIVVEGTLGEVVQTVRATRNKSQEQNRKNLYRSILAYLQDYSVRWLFCDSRALAEASTFRFLERFYRHSAKDEKTAQKLVARI